MDTSKHEGGDPTSGSPIDSNSELPTISEDDLGPMRYLGSGEFCDVLATTLKGKPVAVKVLKESQVKNATARRDLAQEIALMGSMCHRNVLRPLAQGEFRESPLLVLPIIGQMLSDQLPKPSGTVPVWTRRAQCKRWPLSRALRCGVELAEALHYCHTNARPDCRVLHRDIKPNNIGFLSDGRLVLFDFGLAKLWVIDGEDTQTRKLTGQTGSLRYMAPEVAMNQPYNHKAEIFSFATCLWQMCSHEVPYFELDVDSFMERVCKKGERPRMKKDWPPALTKLMSECWQPLHTSRPELSELLPTLRKLHDEASMAEPRPPKENNNLNSRPQTA